MEQLHLPVAVQKLEKQNKSLKGSPHSRIHIGTVYFCEGTTANHVCVHIQRKQQTKAGLWLLQEKASDSKIGQGRGMDDSDYTTIKDSKYVLQDGKQYVAIHYSGMDIEVTI